MLRFPLTIDRMAVIKKINKTKDIKEGEKKTLIDSLYGSQQGGPSKEVLHDSAASIQQVTKVFVYLFTAALSAVTILAFWFLKRNTQK